MTNMSGWIVTFFVISSDSEKSHATEPIFLAISMAKAATPLL
jgi:hypothetical protein